MIDKTEATELAQKLVALSDHIEEVHIVGSVAQKGFGHDADFVVITDMNIARTWWERYRSQIKVKWPWYLRWCRKAIKQRTLSLYSLTTDKKRIDRLEGAAELLGIDLRQLKNEQNILPDFEMFLLPAGWQKDNKLQISVVGEITPLIHHRNTRGFLENLAKDATLIAG